MQTGRPTKYDPLMCDQVIECGKQGMSIEETCVELDISDDSWYRWSDEESGHKEFCESIKRHKALCYAWWMKEGRTQLQNTKFSFTGWYMNMKNRFGWKDKSETDHTTKGEKITGFMVEFVHGKTEGTVPTDI